MRIVKIGIHNYMGIQDLTEEIPPGGVVLSGTNGTGKTTVLEAIKAILTGHGVDSGAIRTGSDKALIEIDLEHASVRRVITEARSTLRVREEGSTKDTPSPQAYLSALLGVSPIDPMALFLEKDAKKRRAMILGAVPSTVTVAQVRRWCAEINPDMGELARLFGSAGLLLGDAAALPGHGLDALARVRTHFYDIRTATNAEVLSRESDADKAKTRLDDAVTTFGDGPILTIHEAEQAHESARDAWRKAQETNAGADAWTVRVAGTQIKIAGLRESVDLVAHPLPVDPGEEEARALTGAVNVAERMVEHGKGEIAKIEEALRVAKGSLAAYEQALAEAVAARRAVDGRHVAFFEARNKREQVLAQADALEAGIGTAPTRIAAEQIAAIEAAGLAAKAAVARAKGAVALEGVRSELAAAEALTVTTRAKAEALDTVVKRLSNEAPIELLTASNGIPGLTVTADDIFLDGKSLNRLCGAEKLRFAVDITKRSSPAKILLIDGMEAIAPEWMDDFLAHASSDGFQVFGTRVDRGPRVITPVDAAPALPTTEAYDHG